MNLQGAALVAALIGIVISIAGLFYAIDQIKSINSLLEESNKQLEFLNALLAETKQQTIMSTGSP